jgi:hypothetical protein
MSKLSLPGVAQEPGAGQGAKIMTSELNLEIMRMPSRVHSPVSEEAARVIESLWEVAQENPDFLLALNGSEGAQRQQFEVIKTWAAEHEPRISVRRYKTGATRMLYPGKICFTMEPYRPKEHYRHSRPWGEEIMGHPLYSTWAGMIGRCYNPNATSYRRYGGRGIKVCHAWHHAGHFIEYIDNILGPRPEGYSLDRRNNNRGYEPMNVRWADRITQMTNRGGGIVGPPVLPEDFDNYSGPPKWMLSLDPEARDRAFKLAKRLSEYQTEGI